MNKDVEILGEEYKNSLVEEGISKEALEELEKELEMLGIDNGGVNNDAIIRELIYYVKASIEGNKFNGRAIKSNDSKSQAAVWLLENTLINKYLKDKKNPKKTYSKERASIPPTLIELFIHVAKFYRLHGNIDKAKAIIAKIKEDKTYKNNVFCSIMIDEEEAALEISQIEGIGKAMNMTEFITILKKAGVNIEDTVLKIFGGNNNDDKSGHIIPPDPTPDPTPVPKKQYPSDLNVASRLQYFMGNYDIINVRIVEEGKFKGAAIIEIKDSDVCFIENFFEEEEKESYGTATYIVLKELIGSCNWKEESRSSFKSKYKDDISVVYHREKYYENLKNGYERLSSGQKTIIENATNETDLPAIEFEANEKVNLEDLSIEELERIARDLDEQIKKNEEIKRAIVIDEINKKRAIIGRQESQIKSLQEEKKSQQLKGDKHH